MQEELGLGHEAKWEYFRVMYERYHKAESKARSGLLDEFCVTTGYHRKYAIRLLNGPPPEKQRVKRARGRKARYGKTVIAVLTGVWEAAGYPWSVRLKALLPNWMPWIQKRYRLSPEVEKQLLAMSARQMDRRLQGRKREQKRKIYGRTKPGTLLKHHIPVKTDSWDVKEPGFAEVDLVSHSGNSGEGEFAHTLNLTDIHSGWTESSAVLGKSEVAVQQALNQIRAGLPFRLLGVDSDNGSEFINWHLKRWCDENQIQLTRGRPYKKDDNAHIEQKNWTHVRKLLGWDRYDSPAAVEAINAVYRQELRLWMNLYLPSVKLEKKVRVGSKLRRVYSPAQTPLERVLASGQADARRVAELKRLHSTLDPFELSQSIDRKLERVFALANRRLSPKAQAARGVTAVEKPRGGKVQRADFPTALGNPAKSAGFPLSHGHGGDCAVTSLMSRRHRSKLHFQMS
jgi:transposase InsO family protein